jgi:glycosyltransferase involved in cell wall biosynthesis
MRRLKILIIAGWYPSARNPINGIFVREHAKAVSLYNDVVVICREEPNRSIAALYEINDNLEDGVRVMRLRYRRFLVPTISYFIFLLAVFRAFRRLVAGRFRPDVIHAHEYSAGLPAALLGNLCRIPVVISEHYSGFPRGTVPRSDMFIAKFSFEHANIVCPVSQALRRSIERCGIQARFSVVPNVVDMSTFHPEGARSTTKPGNGTRHMLIVARLDTGKGVPYLLESLAKLREKRDDFLLDIVGDGAKRQEYVTLARRLRLGDIVRFHGLKTKGEVADWMRRSNFFVLPSEWENLGCVLIEAMASGLPIIATRVGGIDEVVDEKVGLLVPPKDVQALVEAIDRMLDQHYSYSSAEISSYAQRRWSYQVVGEHTTNLYRMLIREMSQSNCEGLMHRSQLLQAALGVDRGKIGAFTEEDRGEDH